HRCERWMEVNFSEGVHRLRSLHPTVPHTLPNPQRHPVRRNITDFKARRFANPKTAASEKGIEHPVLPLSASDNLGHVFGTERRRVLVLDDRQVHKLMVPLARVKFL